VNIEPAIASQSALSHRDNGRSDDGAAASGRVESITFSIGVDIMAVREIKGWSEITHLPKQPDYVRGVLNLRGVMVPIIDLRCCFGQGKTEATALHVVIVVQVEARLIGLLADQVLDIFSFEASQVQAVPKIARFTRVDLLSGLITIDGTMIALVDLLNLPAERLGAEDADPTAAPLPAPAPPKARCIGPKHYTAPRLGFKGRHANNLTIRHTLTDYQLSSLLIHG
jgi:purine-binding chemotaxis protein CheW